MSGWRVLGERAGRVEQPCGVICAGGILMQDEGPILICPGLILLTLAL